MLDTDGFDLDSLKRADCYHFSIPFEYIEKNYGNDIYEVAIACMEIDVDWDESNGGYTISYSCPDEYLIDSAQGNSGIDEFFENEVYFKLIGELDSEGISREAICL